MNTIGLIFGLFLSITPVVPQKPEGEGEYLSAELEPAPFEGGGGGLSGQKTGREYVKTLRVTNGAPFGQWGFKDFCRIGSYAIGYELKIESKQGLRRDDTSLNGVRLICGSKEGIPDGSYAMSTVGPFGDWKGEVRCLYGNVIASFKLQVEPPRGKRIDDTAANSMKVQCRELVEGTNGLNERKMGTGYGFWGTYGDWSNVCAETTAVCGIRTKVEGDRGPKRDDTGLNDLELYCCE